VLAADALQQPVTPPAHEVSGTKNPASGRATGFALLRKTALNPTSQRHVLASDDQLTDFAGRRGATLFVDHRETVAGQRIANGNSRVLAPAFVVYEPLHHRRFRRGVDKLDCGLWCKPRAQ